MSRALAPADTIGPEMSEVELREWRAADAESIAAIAGEEHLRRWSSMGDDVAAWIERQRAGVRGPSWAICATGDDRPLGKIALRDADHASQATRVAPITAADAPVGELSYWLLPAARGRGLAGDAVCAAVAWAAQHTELRTLVLDIETSNLASMRIADRLGAQRREPPRTQLDRTGERRELVVYALPVRPGADRPRPIQLSR